MNFRKTAVMTLSLLTLCSVQLVSAQSLDIKNHWAVNEITKWEEKKLIEGYEDQTFKPDNSIIRAEFFTIVNRVFGFTSQAQINYTDVSQNDWFAPEIAKAQAAGYIDGYGDGTIKPKNLISRQEAASIIYKLLRLNNPKSLDILSKFSDASSIADWSKQYIAGVVENGYMDGYPDKTCRPTKDITRAESVSMLNRAFGEVITQAGDYDNKTFNGNVTVNASNVKFSGTKINGNLYLTAGAGVGSVELSNVSVSGQIIVAGGSTYKLGGKYSSLVIDAPNINIQLQKGSVDKLVIGKNAVNHTITIDKEATVSNLTSNVAVNIKGEGKVKNKEINTNTENPQNNPNTETKPQTNNTEVNPEVVPQEQQQTVPQEQQQTVPQEQQQTQPEVQQTYVQNLTGYVVSAGSTPGTTVIRYTPVGGNSLKYVKQSSGFSMPLAGADAVGTAYTSGQDLTVAVGEHIGLYEVDGSNKIVKFADIIVYGTDIAAANPDASVLVGSSLAPGSVPGSVKINYTPGAGNSLRYVKQTAVFDTPKVGQDASVIGTAYALGSNIVNAAAGEKIGLYEVDGANKVAKFVVLMINSSDIASSESTGLTNLVLSGNPNNFTFDKNIVVYYGVTVPNEASSITITPTGSGTITVNGQQVASGAASAPIALAEGTEQDINIVLTESGRTPKNYTIKATRLLAVAADLTNLVISGNPNGFSFEPKKYQYEGITIDSSATNITITPTGAGEITISSDSAAAGSGEKGEKVASGTASSPITLTPGTPKVIMITVSETGKQPNNYMIMINGAVD